MAITTTLAAEASLQQDIRKSRFLARAAPIESADDASAFIARVGMREANHNCWAWRIGANYRFNDDGEPGGSAGRPILAAIDGQGLDRVVAVVTRWFGGIKLGVGGLARAYGGCAAECLRLAPRRERVERVQVRVACGFADVPLLYSRLAEFGAQRLSEQASAEGVSMTCDVPEEQVEALAGFVRNLTRGRGGVERAA